MAPKRGQMDEAINPDHYKYGGIEAIDYIQQVCRGLKGDEAVCVTNAIKYISRYQRKNKTKEDQIKDVNKAIWYCQRLITTIEKGESNVRKTNT